MGPANIKRYQLFYENVLFGFHEKQSELLYKTTQLVLHALVALLLYWFSIKTKQSQQSLVMQPTSKDHRGHVIKLDQYDSLRCLLANLIWTSIFHASRIWRAVVLPLNSDGTNPGFGFEGFETFRLFRKWSADHESENFWLVPSLAPPPALYTDALLFFLSPFSSLTCNLSCVKRHFTEKHYFFPLHRVCAEPSQVAENDPRDSNPKHSSRGRNDPRITSLKFSDSFHHYP